MFKFIIISTIILLIVSYFISDTEQIDESPDYITTDSPIIQLKNGRIRGQTILYNEKLINVFRGIGYAVPPIGDLRFRKPILLDNEWNDIYDATTFKSACLQPKYYQILTTDEDCLYLNVWAPVVNGNSLLPVMVYFHPGFWMKGSGVQYENGANIYDSTHLASNEVIVVTINYRLGVFGFLFGDSDGDAPGNMGLWDQLASVKWIINNIKEFGGNPDDITLFGQSSGSMSLSLHSVSPISRHLFSKAILQSGTCYPRHRLSTKADAYQFSKQFAANHKYFGDNVCRDDKNFIDCLKNKSAVELNAANELMWTLGQNENKFFKPIYGDELVPLPLFAATIGPEISANTQFMIGHSHSEGVCYEEIFGDTETHDRYNPKQSYIENISKSLVEEDISDKFIWVKNREVQLETARLYTQSFSDNQTLLVSEQNALKVAAIQSFGDFLNICPTVIFGANIATNPHFKGNVYQYQLTYANAESIAYGSEWASATHGDDLPLMFGRPLNESETFWTERDRFLSEQMVNIWIHFAKNGYPPEVNGNSWVPYSRSSDSSVNVSFVELNPDLERLGRVFVNRYKGNDGYNPTIINNCLNYWKPIYEFEYLTNIFIQ